MMRTADEYQEVMPGLFFWQAYEPSVKSDLSSVAVDSEEGLVFVDPIPLRAGALEELLSGRTVAAVLITNGNHGRAAARYKQQFKAPLYAHPAAVGELQLPVDHLVKEGDRLFCGWEVIELPGFGAGEIALYSRRGRGVMLMGDALVNVESHGFLPLPEKYCTDPKAAKGVLGKLLKFSFEAMTFAHGMPIVSGARQRFEELLR